MALDADLQAVCDAVTAGGTDTIKGQAMATGFCAVLVARMSLSGMITPAQQNKAAAMQAHITTNIADFATAIGV